MTEGIVPVTVALILVWGVARGVNVYEAMVAGIREGLRTCAGIFPALVIMMTAVAMLRASGAVQVLADTAAPLMDRLGVPAECLPLALLRPFYLFCTPQAAPCAGEVRRIPPDDPRRLGRLLDNGWAGVDRCALTQEILLQKRL